MASLEQKTTKLGYSNAYHLLRRCSYKVNKATINAYANKTPLQAVQELLNYSALPNPRPLTSIGTTFLTSTRYPRANNNGRRVNTGFSVGWWWLFNTVEKVSLQFRLQFLLHTFFPTPKEGGDLWNNYDYTELLTYYSKGSVKSLAQDVIKNYNMLFFLNNNLNTVAAPNDNFGREFTELFTIGKGPQIAPGNYTNYTEHDVTQAQRVFTGVTAKDSIVANQRNRFDQVNPITKIPEGYIDPSKHDTGDKTFSAAFNNRVIKGGTSSSEIDTELGDFVNMIFEQTATAKNYARRFYRYFVEREITDEIENDIIAPLAQTLQDNDYEITPMLTQLLTSKHFYDAEDAIAGDAIIGGLIKSPLELYTQTLTIFEVPLPNYRNDGKARRSLLSKMQRMMISTSLNLFQPSDVNGYPGYSTPPYDKNFITTNSLKLRYDGIIDELLQGYVLDGFTMRLNSVLFVQNSGHFLDPSDSNNVLEGFFDLLFIRRPAGERALYFEQALLNGLSKTNWYFVWKNYLASNDPADAELYLNRLIIALVKSPEYQIM
ncbi:MULTISPECIES: DUF1800 family protein [unclassified Polaribacter]|uniref:DUF1800 family protein n=1 Tax=unclassified Polaribacter TaxID=196858 RepID=UPI0011BE67C5|nr:MULTISPECIES: DUF1800 family protein [unclassified Polaribacter]TXD51141.1 DUF1800 domain-containing protein [Polaribacter sp. IC063]TXD56766.1 DUF1800 domain-containing protein [Polaribacter sp. IC066]